MYGKVKEFLTKELADIKAAGLYKEERIITTAQRADIKVRPDKEVLNFCANNYLGLSDNSRLMNAAVETMKTHGFGMSSVRFICGTQDIHKELEAAISDYFHTEDTILYGSCFDANGGLFDGILSAEDAIISDALNHASIIDGVRLCKAKRYRYANANMEELEECLKQAQEQRFRIIATDGVFSMEGDVAPIDQMVDLCNKYQATLMVDEAHGLGVFGREGRGTCDHFNKLPDVEIVMGTFSKSLASIGGFIAADKETINYMKHNVRPYIFTASIAPAATAAVLEALHIMRSEPERNVALWDNTNYAMKAFKDLGFEIGHTQSPIIPLFIRDTEKTFILTHMIFEEGVFVTPVIPPAVPSEDTLIRFALMATHTHEQIDFAVDKIYKCFKKMEVL